MLLNEWVQPLAFRRHSPNLACLCALAGISAARAAFDDLRGIAGERTRAVLRKSIGNQK
jgi:hypothetical protein